MWQILGISLLSGMSTPVGGWIVLRFRNLTKGLLALFLGLAAGIMIAVVLTDLMPTALRSGNKLHFLVGFAAGWLFLWSLRKVMDYVAGPADGSDEAMVFQRLGWFIAIAIALHDLPEGIAIGAGDAVRHDIGILIAVAIALHNIPEGMSIAAPLRLAGMSKARVLFITFLTGWVTPIGTLISLALFRISGVFIALSLAFASGAMMYVVSQDILPESLSQHRWLAILGLFIGAALMVAMHLVHV